MPHVPTASQTVGPFFHFGLMDDDLARVTVPGAANEEVRITGIMRDGNGEPIADGMLEFWHPSSGFARVGTDREGRYTMALPRPRADAPDGALYFSVVVFARGLLRHLHTRCYLPGQAENALARDKALAAIPDPARRATLIGQAEGEGVRFDLVLQGAGETAFFAL